jgi:dTDP-4-dehydrorhamnose reductase
LANRLAVTGASGVLGMAVALDARKRGYEVIALYHSVVPAIPDASAEKLDIRNSIEVERYFSRIRPDGIIHTAAEVRVDWCEDHPDEAASTNVEGSRNIAEAARNCGSSLLFVSTDSVFRGDRGNYLEDDETFPLNVYARTKLAGEDAVLGAFPTAIVARTTFYGWGGEHKPGLLGWILGELEHGRELPGFTDVVFCPVPVEDVAEVLLDLFERNCSGRYNVVGSEAISKYNFARRVAQKLGYDPNLVKPSKLVDLNMRARRPLDTSLNIERLRKMLGRDMPNVAEGLEKVARSRRVDRTKREDG